MGQALSRSEPETGPAFVVEGPQAFSRSLIWRLQQSYFDGRGIEAWRREEVPHYVTSNPAIAHTYAKMVFAFRSDLDRLGSDEAREEPLTICELGAGSGRFAHHFLRCLKELCEEAGMAMERFRYIVTDIVPANLDFCLAHPRFRPFLERGLLDAASFDVTRPGPLELRRSGRTIANGDLACPLVVIANYLFDSIPQDLFHFREGRAFECRVSLSIDQDPDALEVVELLDALELRYHDAPLARPPYAEEELARLFETYRRAFSGTHLLFPGPALRCLRGLSGLSRGGLLLLSADKGQHRLEALEGAAPPRLVRHGSFSLTVNYHAFASICEAEGGLALLPSRHRYIDMVACLTVAGAERYKETRRAYDRHVRNFGPDDHYCRIVEARQSIPDMDVRDVLANLQFARHDGNLFARCIPRLIELAGELDEDVRDEVREAADRAWALHYPIGEEADLANGIAGLLYAMDDHAGALSYFERSLAIYGPDTGTLYNMACCRHLLGRDAEAAATLDRVVRHDPGNAEAQALRTLCAAAA